MMPGTIGTVMPRSAHASTKLQYASALKKYCVIAEFAPASILRAEAPDVVIGIARLRMVFRIGGDIDVEPVARLVTDESHQLVRIAEIADVGAARWQVASQRDQVTDAVPAVLRRARRECRRACCRCMKCAARLPCRPRGSRAPWRACPPASNHRRRTSPSRTPASASRTRRVPHEASLRHRRCGAERTRDCTAAAAALTLCGSGSATTAPTRSGCRRSRRTRPPRSRRR